MRNAMGKWGREICTEGHGKYATAAARCAYYITAVHVFVLQSKSNFNHKHIILPLVHLVLLPVLRRSVHCRQSSRYIHMLYHIITIEVQPKSIKFQAQNPIVPIIYYVPVVRLLLLLPRHLLRRSPRWGQTWRSPSSAAAPFPPVRGLSPFSCPVVSAAVLLRGRNWKDVIVTRKRNRRRWERMVTNWPSYDFAIDIVVFVEHIDTSRKVRQPLWYRDLPSGAALVIQTTQLVIPNTSTL